MVPIGWLILNEVIRHHSAATWLPGKIGPVLHSECKLTETRRNKRDVDLNVYILCQHYIIKLGLDVILQTTNFIIL